MPKPDPDTMYIGADYYPEHWPRERWDRDAELMQQAGFNVVRLAEFAWVMMEPREGQFDFAWLDDALAVLARRGISALLCTPTAAMPAWVAADYPDTLATEPNGQRVAWGVRKNNCFTSGTYRLLSERITRAMAEHFRDTPNVIGWQTDNEFGGPVCNCDSCLGGFRQWLRERYGDLDTLNAAWGTHFWGHTAQAWSEIPFPRNWGGHNPSAVLDWKRYHSWLNVRFQADQVRILREVCPQHFVTHNLMGLYKDLNYYDLAADLDFVSWDNYPVWGPPDTRYDASLAADVMRGLKRKNFWIMEQTAGPCGWGPFGRNVRPGELRSVAYQQLAHGADGQVWFRWRTCTVGREQYWHGLLGHDGVPGRRYAEAARTAAEYRKLWPELSGTTVQADVAMIYDYESVWALDHQPAFKGNTVQDAMKRYHRALFRAGVNMDIVPPSADLAGYRLVIAPALHLLPDAVADRLVAYVAGGGVLLVDSRTGVKDEHNRCHDRTLPGRLAPALGIRIDEYEAIPEGVEYTLVAQDRRFTAIQYADWVTPESAQTFAGYDQWHMEPYAALTRNAHGHGKGWYLGTIAKEEAFYDHLIERLLDDAGVEPVVRPPAGVEVSLRQGQGRRLMLLINHTEQPQSIPVPSGKTELITGQTTGETIELGRHGVAVIKL